MVFVVLQAVTSLVAAPPTNDSSPATKASKAEPTAREAALEDTFRRMLSGATLEGNFTSTGPGSDSSNLSRDKYTLGEVKKLADHVWLIPARIQYAEHDVTLPVTVPVYWAADTPVIVVDNVGLPGFGAVSARVMFFEDHYAGYWKHGDRGGHLFGTIKPADKQREKPAPAEQSPTSRSDSPGRQ